MNESDGNGCTPLMRAASNNDVAMFELLVKKGGVDVNLGDKDGFTALSYGASKNRTAVVTWLVDEGGANVDQACQRRRRLTSS